MNTVAESSSAPPIARISGAQQCGTANDRHLAGRSVRHGVIGAASMLLFYVGVVRIASGSWTHLADQARLDWYYLVAIIAGFGTQVALVSELRLRHRLGRRSAAAGGAGAGASTVGMVACCAHHLADVLPIIGAASAAGFLTDHRIAFMLTGIAINLTAVGFAARQLFRAPHHHESTT
ncbi:MAG: hypothetical protein HY828_03555 [Actinobacteria bacterium]|nr:hypothetical protein [Actinomycetota bacterium]